MSMSTDERDGIQIAIDEGKTDAEIVALLMQHTDVDEVTAKMIVEHRRDPNLPWPE